MELRANAFSLSFSPFGVGVRVNRNRSDAHSLRTCLPSHFFSFRHFPKGESWESGARSSSLSPSPHNKVRFWETVLICAVNTQLLRARVTSEAFDSVYDFSLRLLRIVKAWYIWCCFRIVSSGWLSTECILRSRITTILVHNFCIIQFPGTFGKNLQQFSLQQMVPKGAYFGGGCGMSLLPLFQPSV